MKRSRLAAISAVAILLAGVTYAYAAGMFQGFPIIGGAAYCSTGTGASGSAACVSTTPAGPTSLSGTEVIPADTGFASGRSPQTVLIPVGTLGAALPSYALYGPATSSNVFTVSANVGAVVISSSAALSATTMQMPAAPTDGQRIRLSSMQTIGTLLISPNTGQTVQNKPTQLNVSNNVAYGYEWIYRSADGGWYRLQ